MRSDQKIVYDHGLTSRWHPHTAEGGLHTTNTQRKIFQMSGNVDVCLGVWNSADGLHLKDSLIFLHTTFDHQWKNM